MEQLEQLSPNSQKPLPHVGPQKPQSRGQVEQLSPSSHLPLPQVGPLLQSGSGVAASAWSQVSKPASPSGASSQTESMAHGVADSMLLERLLRPSPVMRLPQ